MAVATVVAFTLGSAAPAFAHAELLSSSPSNGAQLAESPAEIVLQFSETVDVTEIRLLDAGAVDADLGPVSASGSTIRIDVPPLADGGYALTWRLVSKDGHPVTGSLAFAVGDSAVPPVPGSVPGAISLWRGWSLVQSLARFVHYAGFLIALGLWMFVAICWWSGNADRTVRRIVWLAGGAGVVGALSRLAAQPAYTGATLADIMRTNTAMGWVLGAAAAGLVMVLAIGDSRAMGRRVHLAALGLCLLLGGWAIAIGGHGAAGRLPALGAALTIVHIGVAAAWVGGLVGSFVRLRQGDDDARVVVTTFSRLAFVGVIVLVVTGVAQGIRQLPTQDALFHTDFGRVLIVKVALVAATLLVAVVSRRILRSGEFALADGDVVRRWPWQRALPRSVSVELCLSALVLVTTGFLAGASPIVSRASNPQEFELPNEGRVASVWIGPATTGLNSLHLTVTAPDGVAPDEIKAVIAPDDGSISPIDVPLTAAGPGHMISSEFVIPAAGPWVVTITARFGDFTAVTFSGPFSVVQAQAP